MPEKAIEPLNNSRDVWKPVHIVLIPCRDPDCTAAPGFPWHYHEQKPTDAEW